MGLSASSREASSGWKAKVRASVKAGIILGVLLAWANPTLAQSSELSQPLPQISFEPMKEVEADAVMKEFSAGFPSLMTSKYRENDYVPLRVFLPVEAKGPVPVVLILHYWGARDLKVERTLASQLARRGIGSAIMALPYHLGRTPAGYSSGELAIQPDPEELKRTMTQAVLDARRALDFLNSRSEFLAGPVGIAGTSLGALVSSLVFSNDPRVTHATFVLGGADLAGILWTSSRVVREREVFRRRGYTEEKLRAALVDIEPLTYLPNRKGGEAFVIAGKFDTVIPPASTEKLIGALESPRVLLLDTGHYGGIFVQTRILKEVATFFATEFQGNDYKAPDRIFAPTVRVGAQVNSASGFDIGVGIDLIRFDAKGDTFGTFLITPRGPQVFLGQRISHGLAIGAVGNTRKIGFGLFWSAVL